MTGTMSVSEQQAARIITDKHGENYTLMPLAMTDLQDYYALHADPRVWTHLPSGRHQDILQTEQQLKSIVAEWESGISYWAVRSAAGALSGVGGARSLLGGKAWNIYYRVSPEYWGRGLATMIADQAVELLSEVDSDTVVVAYMLENNPLSAKIAEKLGFERRWSGSDTGNPDPKAVRIIYSSQKLNDRLLEELIAL